MKIAMRAIVYLYYSFRGFEEDILHLGTQRSVSNVSDFQVLVIFFSFRGAGRIYWFYIDVLRLFSMYNQ